MSNIETELEKYQRLLKESNKNMEIARTALECSRKIYEEMKMDHEKIKNLISQIKDGILRT